MSNSSFCTTAGKVMMPGFQTTWENGNCILFLFQGFVLDEVWKYILGLILAFIFGFSNEVLLYLRRWITVMTADKHQAWKMLICLVYGIHMILAYWMMLLVMTYEILIFFSIVFGLMFGHLVFLFVPACGKSKNVKVHSEGSTPCCGGAWAGQESNKLSI